MMKTKKGWMEMGIIKTKTTQWLQSDVMIETCCWNIEFIIKKAPISWSIVIIEQIILKTFPSILLRFSPTAKLKNVLKFPTLLLQNRYKTAFCINPTVHRKCVMNERVWWNAGNNGGEKDIMHL